MFFFPTPPMIQILSLCFMWHDSWLASRGNGGFTLRISQENSQAENSQPSINYTFTPFCDRLLLKKNHVKTYHGKVCIAVNYIFLHTGHAMIFGAGSIWSCISSFLMPPSFSWFEAPKIRHAHPWWVSWLMMLEGGRWCCIQSQGLVSHLNRGLASPSIGLPTFQLGLNVQEYLWEKCGGHQHVLGRRIRWRMQLGS